MLLHISTSNFPMFRIMYIFFGLYLYGKRFFLLQKSSKIGFILVDFFFIFVNDIITFCVLYPFFVTYPSRKIFFSLKISRTHCITGHRPPSPLAISLPKGEIIGAKAPLWGMRFASLAYPHFHP